jgi:hypothetical protein
MMERRSLLPASLGIGSSIAPQLTTGLNRFDGSFDFRGAIA